MAAHLNHAQALYAEILRHAPEPASQGATGLAPPTTHQLSPALQQVLSGTRNAHTYHQLAPDLQALAWVFHAPGVEVAVLDAELPHYSTQHVIEVLVANDYFRPDAPTGLHFLVSSPDLSGRLMLVSAARAVAAWATYATALYALPSRFCDQYVQLMPREWATACARNRRPPASVVLVRPGVFEATCSTTQQLIEFRANDIVGAAVALRRRAGPS